MSAVGFAYGVDADGRPVVVAGDRGPVSQAGEALADGGTVHVYPDGEGAVVAAVGPAAEAMVLGWPAPAPGPEPDA
jgi:hypothetical protein